MTHFLLALAVLALAVVVALEAWSHVGGLAPPAGPSWLRRFVTWVGHSGLRGARRHRRGRDGFGPASGRGRGREAPRRSRSPIRCTCTSAWPPRSGSACSSSAGSSCACAIGIPGLLWLWGVLLGVLVAQAILGEVQYRTRAPVGARPRARLPCRGDLGASSARAVLRYALWRPRLTLPLSPLTSSSAEWQRSSDLRAPDPRAAGPDRRVSGLERRRAGGDARCRLPRALWEAEKFADIDPSSSSTSRRRGRSSRSTRGRRGKSSGRRTRSSERGSRGRTATPCFSSESSRTTAGGPSAT